jgi:hypothetical protein
LKRNDKSGADDGGQDLRDEAGAAWADQPKQQHRDRNRNSGGRQSNGDHDAEGREPSNAAADHEDIDKGRGQQQRHPGNRQRDRCDPHREYVGEIRRRRHDQVEIGTGIEHPRHRFDGLRQYQGPGQEDGRRDDDQLGLAERKRNVGEAADHRIGRQVHDGGEHEQGDDRALPLAAAAGHHRQPFAPGQTDLLPGKPGERRGRTHAAAASASTRAMNMSSRLVSVRPFC